MTEAMAEYVGTLEDSFASPDLQSGCDLKQPSVSIVPGQPQPQAQPLPLPPGWFEMADPSGRTLYCNPTTGTTSWERPSVRQLPPGWMKSQTPDGKTIFIHAATQRCSYEFPSQAQAPMSPPQLQPQPQPQVAQMPQITRFTTAPGKPAAIGTPILNRSQTAPVQASQDPLSVTVSVNTTMARKAVPGYGQALAVHQLSDRNNSTVLTRKFASDLAVTTTAMKDATISGASLATRQAKVAGQIMVDPKRMQKMSKKMVIKTGAMGVKTGRALKSMMGEMVEAADKKGKYQPKNRHFVPYDGQVEYQMKVPVQGPAQVPGRVHESEYQHQQQQQQPQQVSPQSVVQSHIGTIPPTTTGGIPARRPVRPQSVTINGMLPLTQANQTEVPAMVNPGPGAEAVQQFVPYDSPAEHVDHHTLGLQVDFEGRITHNASSAAASMKPPLTAQQSTAPQQSSNESSQTGASVDISSHLTAQSPTANPSLLAGVPPTAHLATPNTPHTVNASQNPTNSYSLQAQGSVTIQASAGGSAPPPYTQAVPSYGTTTPSQTVNRVPPRRRPAPSASHQSPQPIYHQPQNGPQHGGLPQDQISLVPGTAGGGGGGGGSVVYETYNFVQPQPSTVVVYQEAQTMPYTMQHQMLAQMLAPPEQNIIIEQNQTIIQQQPIVNNDTLVVNNETLVIQQPEMTAQEYELYVQQSSGVGIQDQEMYGEYTVYEDGTAAEEVMYAEGYTGEVDIEVEYDIQGVGGYEEIGTVDVGECC